MSCEVSEFLLSATEPPAEAGFPTRLRGLTRRWSAALPCGPKVFAWEPCRPYGTLGVVPTLPSAEGAGLPCSAPTALHSGRKWIALFQQLFGNRVLAQALKASSTRTARRNEFFSKLW